MPAAGARNGQRAGQHAPPAPADHLRAVHESAGRKKQFLTRRQQPQIEGLLRRDTARQEYINHGLGVRFGRSRLRLKLEKIAHGRSHAADQTGVEKLATIRPAEANTLPRPSTTARGSCT